MPSIRMFPISSSGSASSTSTSAYLPTSSVPSSSSIPLAMAPLRVTATIASIGVMPSSTSPSVAITLPMPNACLSAFFSRRNSGAAPR